LKKSKKVLILTAVLCLSLVGFTMAESKLVDNMEFTGEGNTLTLDQAVEVMLKDNPTLIQADLDMEAAKVESQQKRSDARKARKADDSNKEGSRSNLQVKLLELQADFIKANAERNHQVTVEKLKAEVEEAYFNLLQAMEMEEINKANVEISKDLHEKTKKKYELGLIAKQEVLNSELSLIKAENEYKSIQNNVKLAKMVLNQKLGYEVMTELQLEGKLEYKEFKLESIADAISKALINRNEIKAAEFGYEAAKVSLDLISKQYPENTFFYKEEENKLKKAKASLADAKKGIEIEVRGNYLDILQKQEEIKAGQKSVELAEEALRLNQLSYDVGMSVLTDVQQAQTTLLQAKLGLSQLILDYNLAVMKFEDSIGIGRTKM